MGERETAAMAASGSSKSNFWQNNSVGDMLSGFGNLLGGIGAIKTGNSGMLYNPGNPQSQQQQPGQQPMSKTAEGTNWLVWGGVLLAVVVVIILVIVLMRKK